MTVRVRARPKIHYFFYRQRTYLRSPGGGLGRLTCPRAHVLTYFLRAYVLTCLRAYLLTCLRAYLLTYLPAYLLTYLPTYLLTYSRSYRWRASEGRHSSDDHWRGPGRVWQDAR